MKWVPGALQNLDNRWCPLASTYSSVQWAYILICGFPGSGVFVVGTCLGNVAVPGKVAPWALPWRVPLSLCKHDTCDFSVGLCSKIAAPGHYSTPYFLALCSIWSWGSLTLLWPPACWSWETDPLWPPISSQSACGRCHP